MSSINDLRAALLAAAIMVGACVTAQAQDTGESAAPADDTATPVLTLDTMTVTASRHEQSVQDEPTAVTVVADDEIAEVAPRTPAEALRYKPGIWIQKTGHLGGAPIIRGFIGNKVLYMFDGIRQNTAGAFAGPNSNLQNVDVFDVDRIEVVRGPGSVLYGSDAIGGVVNVFTNENPIFSEALRLGGRTYGRYGSVDDELGFRQEAFLSTDRVYVFGGFSKREVGDLEGGRGIGTQEPSAWDEYSWDAQLDLKLDADHRVEFFVQSFHRPEGLRFDKPNWVQSNDRELYGIRYFGQDIGFIEELRVTGFYHDQESFIDEKFWDSDSNEETWGGELQASSYVTDDLHVVYGGEYHYDRIEKTNPQGHTVDPTVDWHSLALFALSEWQLTDRLRLDVGLRWDRSSLRSTAPSVDKLDGTVQTAIANGSFAASDLELDQTNDAFTGGIGLVYALTDELNWVGHVGRAFRAPNKSDMLSFGQFTQGFGVPAGSLEPESSWTVETGLHVQTENLSGSVTVFHTILNDAIIQVASTFDGKDFVDVNGNATKDAGEQVYKKENSSERLSVTGVELEGQYYLPESLYGGLIGTGDLSLIGNFTWLEASATGDDALLGNANGTIPMNGMLGLRWEDTRDPARRRSWLQVEVAMVDTFRDATDADLASDPAFHTDPQNVGSPLLNGDGSVSGYAVVNLRAGHRLNDHATITLAAENLTNEAYRDAYSRIDAPGTNIVASLELRY